MGNRLIMCAKGEKPGWWCSRGWLHDGPCALRPRWWNLPARFLWRFGQ